MINSECKTCRRLGVKLFLKGEKCLSPKCTLIKKPYPPGQRRKRRRRGDSEYGKELREKQMLKSWYNLAEGQLRKYVKDVLGARGGAEDAGNLLVKTLESRLDNVVFRLNFAPSRSAARQIISHGHFLVNDKPVNIPSYIVKLGDTVKLKANSAKKTIFRNLPAVLKKTKSPSWLQLNPELLEGKVVGQPSFEEAAPPAEISSIFEFYSR